MKTLVLVLALLSPAGAQVSTILPAQGPIPQPQLLDLNVMEALVAVRAQDLAGVFGFVAPEYAPFALADYLLHNRKAMKRLLKKDQADLKQTGGVSAFDKQVFMAVAQINQGVELPPGVLRLSKKEDFDVSEIVLARGLTLQELAMAKGARQ